MVRWSLPGSPQPGSTTSDFLYHLKLVANSWVVFDKANTTYGQFSKWTREKIRFMTRERENADYHATKLILDKTKKHKARVG